MYLKNWLRNVSQKLGEKCILKTEDEKCISKLGEKCISKNVREM